MKYLLYAVFFLFFSCNSDSDIDCESEDSVLAKRIDINYTSYGNYKTVTYYEEEKPVIDSTFYFGDSYPEMYQSRKIWTYNENGLVKKINTSFPQNENYSFVEILYDNQQRISNTNYSNNGSDSHATFTYNGVQVTKTHYTQGYNYIKQYEINQNSHLIAEAYPNGGEQRLQYLNNNVIQWMDAQVNLQISYLDYAIPAFMKHREFGEKQANFTLFNGMHINALLNIGDKFVNEIIDTNNNSWTDLNFSYEFNEELLPVYIKVSYDNEDYTYSETFFEYD